MLPQFCANSFHYIQSDLTFPHTSALDEIVDKVRELDK